MLTECRLFSHSFERHTRGHAREERDGWDYSVCVWEVGTGRRETLCFALLCFACALRTDWEKQFTLWNTWDET